MKPALAILYHDPEGKLDAEVAQCLPLLNEIYGAIAICASPQANPSVLDRWAAAGAQIQVETRGDDLAIYRLGKARRIAITLALETGADFAHYCDGDRILHWAQQYPDELRQASQRVAEADFTVLGRTARAFESHPGVQRDTEAIINQVFRRVSGFDWDMGSGSRGVSRRAMDYLSAHCADETLSVDVTWPLCLRQRPDLSMAYWTVEGLEFESGDGYDHQQIDQAHYADWLDQLDQDPQRWAFRLKIAQLMVDKIIEYT